MHRHRHKDSTDLRSPEQVSSVNPSTKSKRRKRTPPFLSRHKLSNSLTTKHDAIQLANDAYFLNVEFPDTEEFEPVKVALKRMKDNSIRQNDPKLGYYQGSL